MSPKNLQTSPPKCPTNPQKSYLKKSCSQKSNQKSVFFPYIIVLQFQRILVFVMITGSELIILNLEKLLLSSDSMENNDFEEKWEKISFKTSNLIFSLYRFSCACNNFLSVCSAWAWCKIAVVGGQTGRQAGRRGLAATGYPDRCSGRIVLVNGNLGRASAESAELKPSSYGNLKRSICMFGRF